MFIPITLLFGAVGYLIYKSKDELTLAEEGQLGKTSERKEEDDLYKELEDLFI